MKTKKYIRYSLLFALALLFVSCSSDSPSWDTDPTLKSGNAINIKVGDFENFSTNLRSISLSQADIKSMYYVVTSESRRVLHARFLTDQEMVTGIKDTLPNGKYKITLLAATEKSRHQGASRGWYLEEAFLFPYKGMSWHDESTSDMFEWYQTIELKNQSLSLDITMKRIMAKVEVIPTDIADFPADVDKVCVFLGYTTDRGLISRSAFNFLIYSLENHQAQFYGDYSLESVEQEDASGSYSRNTILSSKLYDQQAYATLSESNPIELYIATPGDFSDKALFARIYYKDGTSKFKLLKLDMKLERNMLMRLKGNVFKPNNSNAQTSIELNADWSETVEDTIDR